MTKALSELKQIIHDDLIVYRAPSKRRDSGVCDYDDYTGWELQVVNYRYARLCSIIMKTLYGHASLRMSPLDAVASIKRLSTMLKAWRSSIPATFSPDSKVNHTNHHVQPWGLCVQSDLVLKYAEASFAIHRWAIMGSKIDLQVTAECSASQVECVETAKTVLDSTHAFRVHDSETHWYVRQREQHDLLRPDFCSLHLNRHQVMLSLLSAAILYCVVLKQAGGKDILPYLGMACGYFGRLNTYDSMATDLFDEVSELYLLTYLKSGGNPHREPSRGNVELPGLSDQYDRLSQYDGIFAEFEPTPNVGLDVLSLPPVEQSRPLQLAPDSALNMSHLDDFVSGE